MASHSGNSLPSPAKKARNTAKSLAMRRRFRAGGKCANW